MNFKRGRIVACGAGVVAATLWLGQAPDRSVGVTEPARDVHTDPLPEGFDRELASSGITYTVVAGPTEQQISDARESVLGGFGGILDEGGTAAVMRVRFTDKFSGHVDDPDAPTPPTLTPYFTDRDALMVVLAHQLMPISHPDPAAIPKRWHVHFPEAVEGTFVAFVDMKTNEVLRAISFSS